MVAIFADDSDLILERLKDTATLFPNLKVAGSFKNGIDALEAMKRLQPDLAVADIRMPGMSGLKVLTELRKENWTGIFIVLTLYPFEIYRQQALNAGADYFFSKADDFDKVGWVIAKMGEKGKNAEPGNDNLHEPYYKTNN